MVACCACLKLPERCLNPLTAILALERCGSGVGNRGQPARPRCSFSSYAAGSLLTLEGVLCPLCLASGAPRLAAAFSISAFTSAPIRTITPLT